MHRRHALLVVLTLVIAGAGGLAQEEQTREAQSRGPVVGRSMVATQFGIVAASQPLAARAGVQILERGGNAVDAAIAANATIGLMEPTGNGIGGDLFVIYYDAKTRTVHGLNSSGWSATGLTVDFLATKGITNMPQRGIYSVTVPGVVAGWDALRAKFGSKPFSELLAPAIYYADHGFPVSEVTARNWSGSVKMHSEHPELTQDLSRRRHAGAESRRGLPQSRSRRLAPPDRGDGTRRLLQGKNGRSDSPDLPGTGRHDDSG
jgi:gamma-glutamyltranspeptidase